MAFVGIGGKPVASVGPLFAHGRGRAATDGHLIASAVFDKASSSYIVKVANTSKEPQPLKVNFKLKSKKQKLAGAHVITLQSDNLEAENTLDEPNKISTKESNMTISGNCLDTTIAPETFAVYIVK